MLPTPPSSTLFPSTTLFRSRIADGERPSLHLRGSILFELVERLGLDRAESLAEERVGAQGVRGSNLDLRRTGRDVDAADLAGRSEEHTSELQSQSNIVCRLL